MYLAATVAGDITTSIIKGRPMRGLLFLDVYDLDLRLMLILTEMLVFQEWRSVVGRAIKPKYERYVELKNKRAQLNHYNDYGDEWRSRY